MEICSPLFRSRLRSNSALLPPLTRSV